jgi:mRNA-degrading endonuclease RelE of RelBE toxin-antitoxin system
MYCIDWKAKALKQLEKIDRQAREDIRGAVGRLSDWPNVQQVKKLVNHDCDYRLRVGNYRVIFDVLDAVRIIKIEEVKKRDDRTY